MLSHIHPMPLLKRRSPFDDPDWIFELKYDGFRAFAVLKAGKAQLLSRNGNAFASFGDLCSQIAATLPKADETVIDGEIVCIDAVGKPRFNDLLFHRGAPCFFAFDLLKRDGKDLRLQGLADRKQELRRLLAKISPPFPLRYADHIEGKGMALFERVCELDLEGIVAKLKHAPYVSDRESSTWVKILNRSYSQKEGREELFERDRHREPVPGWHSCDLACSDIEAVT
jgi:bifunctional non-homologous end joining protein LigD